MKKRNSIQEVIDFLKQKPFSTETQIQIACWNYDRSDCWSGSNQKYTNLLRRGLESGKIGRVKKRVAGSRSSCFYFVPK